MLSGSMPCLLVFTGWHMQQSASCSCESTVYAVLSV
jgi:hypothetical protein